MEMKKYNIRWLYLVIGTISMFFSGIIYTWSIIKVPMIKETGWDASAVNVSYTLLIGFFCIGAVITGLFANKLNPAILIIGGGIMTFLGFFITSRVSGNAIWQLYLGYGFLNGVGIGTSYTMVLTLVNSWFPEKRGLSTGVLMMSFGLSTIVLGRVEEFLFTFHDLGWRNTYLLNGIVIGIIIIIAGIILRNPPAELAAAGAGKVKNISAVDYRPSEVLKRKSFWLVFFMLLLMSSLGCGIVGVARELIIFIGSGEKAATTIVGVLSLSNGIGRVTIGTIFDKFGLYKAKLIAGAASVISAVIVLIAIVTKCVPLGVVGFIIVGLSYGCCPTLCSFVSSAFYGTKYFAMNLAFVNFHIMISAIMAPFISFLNAKTGGFTVPTVLILCCTIAALILNLRVKKA